MPEHRLPDLGCLKLDDSFELDLDYYLKCEYEIGQAASELPAVIEWVNMKLQEVTESKIVAKQEINEIEAAAYFNLKDGDFSETYRQKMTEAALTKAIAIHEDVKAAHRKYATLCGWVLRLSNLQFSLQSKLELTRSTEATRRNLIATENKDNDL